MAKRPSRGAGKPSKRGKGKRSSKRQPQETPFHSTGPKTAKRRNPAPILAVVAAAIYLVVLWFVLPNQLPWFLYWLLGLVSAAVGVGIFRVGTHKPPSDEIARRLRKGQHQDFGKALRQERKRPTSITLPVVGETSFRALGSSGVALAVLVWWLTPLAPVSIRPPEVDDLAEPLGAEIMAVVLVEPDGDLAVAYPPVVPSGVRTAARLIRDDAAPYDLALRAIAEGRFTQAGPLLESALREPEADTGKIRMVQGQSELLAGNSTESLARYEEALQASPGEPVLLCQAAVAALVAGEYEKAGVWASRAVDFATGKLSEDDPQLAAALHVQAAVWAARGESYEEAARLNTRAATVWAETYGETSTQAAATQNNQAVLFQLRAQYSPARNGHALARDMWAETLAAMTPNHPYLAVTRNNMAVLDETEGRYADAKKLLDQITAMYESVPADQLPLVPIGREVRAAGELATGQFQAARNTARALLSALEAKRGPDHPQAAAVLGALAGVHAALAQYTLAERYALRARDVVDGALGEKHPRRAVTLATLASVYLKAGRSSDADSIAAAAVEIARESLGPDHPTTARLEIVRGSCLAAEGDMEKAEELLTSAVRTLRSALGSGDHPALAAAAVELAKLAAARGRFEPAAKQFQEALDMVERVQGPEHPAVAEIRVGLGRVYLQQKKWEEADKEFRAAMTLQNKILPEYHPDRAVTMEAYAEWVRERGGPKAEQKARKLLEQAQTIRDKHAEFDRAKR